MASERIVIDSSYLIESVLPTNPEWQYEADALMDALIERRVLGVVPWITFAELAAVCSRKVRARALSKEDAEHFLDTVKLLSLDIDIQLESPRKLYDDCMAIQAQAFDTIYLMLAKRMGGLPIATRDRGMITGANGARLPLYTP